MFRICLITLLISLMACNDSGTSPQDTSLEDSQQREEEEIVLNQFPVDPNFHVFKDQLEEFDGTFQSTTYSADFSNSEFALKFSLSQKSSINQITFSGGNKKRNSNDDNVIKIAYKFYEVSGSGLFRTLTEIESGVSISDFSITTGSVGTYNILFETPVELESGNYALSLRSDHTSDSELSIGFRQNQAGYRYYSYDSNFDEWRENGIAKLLIRLAGICIEPCN